MSNLFFANQLFEFYRWMTEALSGKNECKDRLLEQAVRKLKKGDVLIVTKLSRLSRSLHKIMEIMKHNTRSPTKVLKKNGFTCTP